MCVAMASTSPDSRPADRDSAHHLDLNQEGLRVVAVAIKEQSTDQQRYSVADEAT